MRALFFLFIVVSCFPVFGDNSDGGPQILDATRTSEIFNSYSDEEGVEKNFVPPRKFDPDSFQNEHMEILGHFLEQNLDLEDKHFNDFPIIEENAEDITATGTFGVSSTSRQLDLKKDRSKE